MFRVALQVRVIAIYLVINEKLQTILHPGREVVGTPPMNPRPS